MIDHPSPGGLHHDLHYVRVASGMKNREAPWCDIVYPTVPRSPFPHSRIQRRSLKASADPLIHRRRAKITLEHAKNGKSLPFPYMYVRVHRVGEGGRGE